MALLSFGNSLQRLMSMGFEYESVLSALQNAVDEQEAIDILLGTGPEQLAPATPRKKLRSYQRIDTDVYLNEEEVTNEYGKYHLVFGYCRGIEIVFNLYSILPTEIKQLIHLYQVCETWDTEYSDPNLIFGTYSIKKWDTGSICTAVGTTVVGYNETYVWKIRIKSSSDSYKYYKGWFAYIGIVKDSQVHRDMVTRWKSDGTGYAFDCGGANKIVVSTARVICGTTGSKVSYGMQFTSPGDTMQIALDLNVGTLSYLINGEDFGVAFDNIESDDYVFCMSISNMVNNIEVEFV
eukprot:105267_1